jgi:hypothetical protein
MVIGVVDAGENDLETFAVHLADRRFSHKLNRHPKPLLPLR